MPADTEAATDFVEYGLFIDGSQRPSGSSRTFDRYSPSDGALVGRFARGDAADVDHAVAGARRVFDDGAWPNLGAEDRARILRAVADRLRADAARIGRRISLELGKPLAMAEGEVTTAATVFDYYAALVLDQRSEMVSRHNPNALGMILKEPVGVVALITPWNYPMMSLVWKVAPALAAGCTAIVKPASLTPGCAIELAQVLVDSGVPAGACNVITGGGSEAGQALIEHSDVDKISFTGSTEVGQGVMRSAANSIKKVGLELGGKSPNIVFDDADFDRAVRNAYWAIFLNTGQACQAGSRLLVQRGIYDDFVQALADRANNSRIGRPMDKGVQIGPVVDQSQLDIVTHYIESGKSAGARLLAGGERLGGDLANGYFVAPTIFEDPRMEYSVSREEIFGPVLTVTPFETAADAIRLANDSVYGLAAAVWTKDVDKVFGMAKQLQAGTVWVNAYFDAGMPFCMPMGGYKTSGLGRELGREGLDEYLETKSVHLRINNI